MSNSQRFLTAEQALSILPDADCIHTFYNPGLGLIGADCSRQDITDKINNSDKLELTGPYARGMGHGLAAYNDGAYQSDILFIETDEDKLNALEEEMGATSDGGD